MQTILLVDDEKNMLNVLSILFETNGYKVIPAENGELALEIFEKHPEIELVISDLKMPQLDGIQLMEEIRLRDPAVPFILISAYGTIDRAVEAMKLGATDFITKPFNKELILHTVQKVWSFKKIKQENAALKENQKEHNLVFRSPEMYTIMDAVKKVAKFATPVLITGESGSGKEVIARSIHGIYQGENTKPFISINCPAVPATVIESELFGYRKGDFPGADKDFPGKVRLAEGGTLFLDEIGDMPLSLQPRLLQLLESKTIDSPGNNKAIQVNIRIICATNQNLEELVERGEFRQDLLYRINTFHLDLPSLRDRSSDIEPLLEYFLDKYSSELNIGERSFSTEALNVLESYMWPGNVRELRNFVERTVILSSKTEIGVDALPEALQKAELRSIPRNDGKYVVANVEDSLPDIERKLLLDTLEAFDGNISAAARKLGITRNTMRYRLKKHKIESSTNNHEESFG